AQPQATGSLTLSQDQLFHFALSGFSSNPNGWVTMTIVDQNRAAVATLRVQAGQPTVTANLYLAKGDYSFSFSGYTTDGSSLGGLAFDLAGGQINDPVGAYPT